jgi:hypothetical protein
MKKTTATSHEAHNRQKQGLRKQGKRKEAESAPVEMLLFPFSGLILSPLLTGVGRKRPAAHRSQ